MQERKRIFVDTPFLKAAELPLLMLITVVVVALCYVLASYVMPLLLAILISTAMEPAPIDPAKRYGAGFLEKLLCFW